LVGEHGMTGTAQANTATPQTVQRPCDLHSGPAKRSHTRNLPGVRPVTEWRRACDTELPRNRPQRSEIERTTSTRTRGCASGAGQDQRRNSALRGRVRPAAGRGRLRRVWQRLHTQALRQRGRDRGSTTVETVLWFSGLMLAIACAVQATLWGLAYLAASYAANHAVQTTRVYQATASAGHTDATTVLNQIDAKLITGTQVSVNRDANTATVTITGIAIRVLPFISIPVTVTVSAPVEATGP
jgi:Flp pilus assembly protein TadG